MCMVGIIHCVKASISPLWSPEGGFQALGRDRTWEPRIFGQCQGPMRLPDQEPHTCMHSLIHTLTGAHTHICTHSFTRTCIHSSTRADTHLFTHSHMHTLMHTFTRAHTHPHAHTCTHSFTHSHVHTPIHSHTHMCTHSFIHTLTHTQSSLIHTHTHTHTHTGLRSELTVALSQAPLLSELWAPKDRPHLFEWIFQFPVLTTEPGAE